MEGVLYHEECLMRLARKGKLTKKVDGHTVIYGSKHFKFQNDKMRSQGSRDLQGDN